MLGDRLRAMRKTRGMTQHALAEALEISASTVGMYEQGRREPDNGTLAALCRVFGVSSDYFLLDDARRSPELNDLIGDFRNRLLAQEGLMFDGVPLSDGDVAQIVSAIEVGTMVAMNRIKRGPDTGREDKS